MNGNELLMKHRPVSRMLYMGLPSSEMKELLGLWLEHRFPHPRGHLPGSTTHQGASA